MIGSNPVTGSAGTKTLYASDLQDLCAGYYQSALCGAMIGDWITNYISSAHGVVGKEWNTHSVCTAPYGWGLAQMFSLIQGNEYMPNTPAITEILKYSTTGVP